MASVLFAPQGANGQSFFASQTSITIALQALPAGAIVRATTTGPLRLSLTFIDTPAPPERTILLGGRNRTITAG